MAVNTIEYAALFQQALDKQMVQQATSGWMEENAGQVKYSGGKEVKLPRLRMDGLGDYDRDEGFVQGTVTLDFETLTLQKDRGRTFQLDAMDVDETNFALNASAMMAEFQRLHVIPEVDSYRYSTIYRLANAAGRVTAGYTLDPGTILAKLREDVAAVEDETGATELVLTLSVPCAAALSQADGLTRVLEMSSFSQGGLTLAVKSLDGCPIVRVPSARMMTAYAFYDGKTEGAQSAPDQRGGGFTPAADAKPIHWILCPKDAPIAISKTEKLRIFAPDLNPRADAWKLDYRKYHDLWVPQKRLSAFRVCVGA